MHSLELENQNLTWSGQETLPTAVRASLVVKTKTRISVNLSVPHTTVFREPEKTSMSLAVSVSHQQTEIK